jgi:hypothetical protein
MNAVHPAEDGFMSHVKDFYKATYHVASIIFRAKYEKIHGFTEASGGAVVRGTALQAGRSRVQFPMVSLEFH